MTRISRTRQIGWAIVLGACFAALLALTFKVNAVKSEVRLTERQIIAAERQKMMLETEFQTRASQHQLSDWNEVEFGYRAPRADQYLENQRQLAVLGAPRAFDAPRPVRVALAHAEVPAEEEGLVSRLMADEDEAAEARPAPRRDGGRQLAAASSLAQRLARPSAALVAVAEVAE